MFNKKKEVVDVVKETPKERVYEVNSDVVASNPDEKVIDGKLYKSVGYTEDGCAKFKLEEVK
jgi:hypothetical protein